MKNLKYILAFLLAGLYSLSFSQQLPIYNLYHSNNFLINPAIAGYNHSTEVKLSSMQQLAGFINHPSSNVLTFHTRVERIGKYDHAGNIIKKNNTKRTGRVGIGLCLFNDNNGPFTRNGGSFSYAYHLITDKLKNKNLSMGLTLGMYQYSFSPTTTNSEILNDRAVIDNRGSVLIPESNFGVYYYTVDYFISASFTQLLNNAVVISDSETGYSRPARIHIGAGYKYKINDDVFVTGSAFLKTHETARITFDIMPKIYYKNNYWLGLLVNTKTGSGVLLGIKADVFNFIYHYNFSYGAINKYINGNHTFTIGFNFNEKSSINAYL